ncbi:branched-chain amino acid ABC transporter ATP-binding protein/permease [Alcanivorax marinus]|uniref:Branched-chain amino acid ABC transporter ATP-binding protein/permease n=1 Tax=Alloalcanivorax marinus TaxID=1177169 RepID=A0A9Q3UI83_9GAMM|nr:branched-chain amino acid ABC transporter ATP-binding protein/permease [Alloalcanivorax marinus]MCC4307467.1 branched-chain amino acid ABC transporter ATP-binding protein/permease [Alloalcanivorax marinus]MCU5785207.1 ABC transporter-like protein [Alloalcanivorax marinus]
MKRLSIPAGLAVLVAALVMVFFLNSYYVYVLANVALIAIVGVGLNVLLGLTGQISFGHVGFYAIGAYTVAILTSQAGWSFWPAWLAGALVATVAGLILALPALRVKGPYLAMVTIAFSFIVQHAIIEMEALTGGQNGIMGIAAPTLSADWSIEQTVAVLALLTLATSLVAYTLLARGTWGAAMRAVKDSETAAESVGLGPLVIKTVAFMVSAGLAGLAGGLFAPLAGFVTPDTFSFMQSILFVLVVIVGGAGSVIGPVIGAAILGMLPELLATLEAYRLLFFGGLLLVVLLVAPNGLIGLGADLLARWRGAGGAPRARVVTAGAGHSLSERPRQGLRLNGLSMTFGGVRAVSDLTMEVPAASVTSLIGPNGAGKTTVLNMVSGFYPPTAGHFALGERTLGAGRAFRIARHGVARTYQTSQLFDTLSVADNVALAACRGRLGNLLGARRYLSRAARQRAAGLLAFCGYQGPLDVPASQLPHVDRRLVEIARALATDPDALLLDEPAAGLSREDTDRLAALLRAIADAGVAVMVVEHDMELVMRVSDQVVVLDTGRLLAAGKPEQVRADPAVRRAYLGEDLGDARPVAARPPRTGPEWLGVNKLVAGYGAEPVLHGISLKVRQGEMVALLGANGAGKSTLMRALAGLHPVQAGGVHLDGQALEKMPAEAIVRQGLVLVPEGRQVFPELSVQDNIRLGAFLCPADRETRLEEMFERFPRLRERRHQRAGLLSGGEQQMLAVARGLMSRPRVLLLDEPSLGLAPKIIDELFAALDQLRRENMTIVLVDQMAALALSLADRAYVIEGGRVMAEGTAREIAASPELADAYLGASTPAAG